MANGGVGNKVKYNILLLLCHTKESVVYSTEKRKEKVSQKLEFVKFWDRLAYPKRTR